MHKKFARLPALVATLLVALFLAGCGGGGGSSANSQISTDNTAS